MASENQVEEEKENVTHRTFCALVESDERTSRNGKKGTESSERSSRLKRHVIRIRENLIGHHEPFDSPFGGTRPIVYADWTASGRSLRYVEDYVREKVLPFYGNTHTSTSITGLQTTCFRHEARQIIGQAVNAHRKDDVVLMTGSGVTASIVEMVHILGMDVPLEQNAKRPVVFVGPFEHHSNLLPWRESCAEVVVIREDTTGHFDVKHLEEELQKHKGHFMIGSFSACSNVTGVMTDVLKVTAMLHRYGALSFWDYATAAPYVDIDMNPVVLGEDAPYVYKDAVFISPHKFVGGPGSTGVMIAKKRLFANSVPNRPGGGTVFFVTNNDHRYLSNRVEREEGGTPDIVGSIRAALVFQIRNELGSDAKELYALEHRVSQDVLSALKAISNVHVLAHDVDGPRLPIVSFVVRHAKTGRFLHHNFVSALLNDMYGIQARGGCACAGPYALRLLGVTPKNVRGLEHELLEKHELLRPGFSRISFPYFVPKEEIEYVLNAIRQVAEHGWRALPLYRFNHKTGEWSHRKRFTKFPGRLWLSDISSSSSERQGEDNVRTRKDVDFQALLDQAMQTYDDMSYEITKHPLPDQTNVLGGEDAEALRWFVYPSEVVADVTSKSLPSSHLEDDHAKRTAATIPIRPHMYLPSTAVVHSTLEPVAGEDRGTVVFDALEKKFPRRTAVERPSTFSGTPTFSKRRVFKQEEEQSKLSSNGVSRKSRARSSPKKRAREMMTEDSKTPSIETTHVVEEASRQRKKKKKPTAIPKKMSKLVGQAIHQFDMIREGDRLLLGLSGGKDSLTLLHILLALQKKAPIRFDVAAATVDPQNASFNPKPLGAYVRSLGVPYYFLEEPIFDRAKTKLQGNSICSFCARMKRGLLYSCCRREGYNVLVLGQHLDDLAESFIMSAFNNGLIRTMSAHYTITEGDIRVIRPLAYVRESEMRKYSLNAHLPVINENCPACFEAPKERHRVKKMLQQEESHDPQLFNNLRRSLLPLMDADVCETIRKAGESRLKMGKQTTRRHRASGASNAPGNSKPVADEKDGSA